MNYGETDFPPHFNIKGWEEKGYVKAHRNTGKFHVKNGEIYINDEYLVLSAVPLMINDGLINSDSKLLFDLTQCNIAIMEDNKLTPFYQIVFSTNQSDNLVFVYGNSVSELVDQLCDMELVPQDIEEGYEIYPVADYLKTIIFLTRLANKEVY